MTGWPISAEEIAQHLGKTMGATWAWLHRHGIASVQRVGVGEQGTRGIYDGEVVMRHAEGDPDCRTCKRVRSRVR